MSKNMKVSNSIQNIILLLLFVIGMFVLYRYVKTVDIETKMLQNHVIELTEKVHTLSSKSNSIKQHLPKRFDHPSPKTGYLTPPLVEEITRVEDDDNVSIKSVDITNMLRRVMGTDENTEEEDLLINAIVLNVKNDVYSNDNCMKIEEIVEDDVEEDIVEEDDDEISFTQSSATLDTKSVLIKKTNEELKNMLKELSLPTKGSKNELVERIMSHTD